MKSSNYLFITTLLLSFMISGCSKKSSLDIADVRKYSQNPVDYLKNKDIEVNGTKLTTDTIRADFDTRYFAPWNLQSPPYSAQDIRWPWRSYTAQNSFGANQRPIPDSWFKLMLLESDFDAYGKLSKAGIILRTTDMRNFPSNRPVFKNFDQAGEGFPFDYNQNSVITSNEPVLITHYSKTKEWAYVVTSYASGWVLAEDVAIIGSDIIKKWAQSRQAVLVEDDTPLYDLDKNFIGNSRIGMLLPIMKVEDDAYQAIMANSKSGDFVTFAIVRIPKSIAISDPLPLNPQSIAIMAKVMMGKEYGWGGIYNNRDCSSTIRDMFIPFNLWLPRNSKEQAQIGLIYDLSKLKPIQKEKEIIKYGLPFQTVLYKTGHVMLYIGTLDGKAMVMHNLWGIMTKNRGLEGRHIVGRTVITTLEAGKEVGGYVKANALINQVQSMNILGMEPLAAPIVIAPDKREEKAKKSRRGKEEILPEENNATAEQEPSQAEEKPSADEKPKSRRQLRAEQRAAKEAAQ